MHRRRMMRERPDEECGHVDDGEGAQSTEPEEGAVTQMQARAAAGFEPGLGGIGRAVFSVESRGLLEESLGDGGGLRAGGAGFGVLAESVRPKAGAHGAGGIGFVFTADRFHANLFCAFCGERRLAALRRARKSKILMLSARRPVAAAISS